MNKSSIDKQTHYNLWTKKVEHKLFTMLSVILLGLLIKEFSYKQRESHPWNPRVANTIITYKYVGNGMIYPWVSDDEGKPNTNDYHSCIDRYKSMSINPKLDSYNRI